jgi:uncharacterized protein YbaR (Trm112 family)
MDIIANPLTANDLSLVSTHPLRRAAAIEYRVPSLLNDDGVVTQPSLICPETRAFPIPERVPVRESFALRNVGADDLDDFTATIPFLEINVRLHGFPDAIAIVVGRRTSDAPGHTEHE